MVRAVRGAIVAHENTERAIFEATQTLLRAIVEKNQLSVDSVVSVFITATADLNAAFPAYAAREMGWDRIPMLCAQEIQVPGSMARVIRVLIHLNLDEGAGALRHQYLGETRKLRPDLSEAKE